LKISTLQNKNKISLKFYDYLNNSDNSKESQIYVSRNNKKMIRKSTTLYADSIVIDFHDSVQKINSKVVESLLKNLLMY
jgi:hypothetical protein